MSRHITTDGYCAFCTQKATTGKTPIASKEICDCLGHRRYLEAQAALSEREDIAWPYHRAKDRMSYIWDEVLKEWEL